MPVLSTLPAFVSLHSIVQRIGQTEDIDQGLNLILSCCNFIQELKDELLKRKNDLEIISFSYLPDAVLRHTSLFLKIDEVIVMEQICVHWRKSFDKSNASFWRNIFTQTWTTSFDHPAINPHGTYTSWRDRVISRLQIDYNWNNKKNHMSQLTRAPSFPNAMEFLDEMVVTGHQDGVIRIWNILPDNSLVCLSNLHGHLQSINTLHLCHKNLLLTGSNDKKIKLWDLEKGTLSKQTFRGHTNDVISLRMIGVGDTKHSLISASEDHTMKMWDLETGLCLTTYNEHQGRINQISSQGKYWVTASVDRTIKLWSSECKESVMNFIIHKSDVTTIKFEDQLIISGSMDKRVKISDTRTFACIKTLPAFDHGVTCVSKYENKIIVGGYEPGLKMFSLASLFKKTEIYSKSGHPNLEFSPRQGACFTLQFDLTRLLHIAQNGDISVIKLQPHLK